MSLVTLDIRDYTDVELSQRVLDLLIVKQSVGGLLQHNWHAVTLEAIQESDDQPCLPDHINLSMLVLVLVKIRQ